MSNDAVNWAYKQKCPSSGAKFVLVTLCDFADDQGFCYPSQKTIGQMTEQGERTVRAHLAALETAGLIRREHRVRPDGTFKSDGFHIQRRNLPTAKSAAGETGESAAIPVNRPAAKSADGESRQRQELPEPAAKSAVVQRQDSPGMNHQGINHQIEPSGVSLRSTARAKPPRVLLADFQPTAEMIEQAADFGVPRGQIILQTESWRDYHMEKGTAIKDFPASWRRWMRNQVVFAERDAARASPRAPTNGSRPVTFPEQTLKNTMNGIAEFGRIMDEQDALRATDGADGDRLRGGSERPAHARVLGPGERPQR